MTLSHAAIAELADAGAAAGATALARQAARTRWALLSPAIVILTFAAVGPLLIVLVYSFLTPGPYGGVVWSPSIEGWFRVLFQRDIFDDTLHLQDAHLTILWRSVKLSFATTVLALLFGFPTAYFIATRPERSRNSWLFLITIPFWTNLLIRTFAVLQIIRNEGIINTLLIKLGIIDAPIQILFTDSAVMVGMLYVYLPLMVLPIYASLIAIPRNLMPAAAALGAAPLQAFRHVLLPLAMPGLLSGSLLVFMVALGYYITPALTGGAGDQMISSVIAFYATGTANWGMAGALGLFLLVPTTVLYIVYNRLSRTPLVQT